MQSKGNFEEYNDIKYVQNYEVTFENCSIGMSKTCVGKSRDITIKCDVSRIKYLYHVLFLPFFVFFFLGKLFPLFEV